MKAQLADEAKNQPKGATIRSDKLAQQAKNKPPQATVVESVAPHWVKGEVMCFMLPKPSVVPAKLINVYGILAKEILAESRFGTCIMQDGIFSTFSCSVVWAAVERMRDKKFRSRCPLARLTKWFTSKTGDTTELERDKRESEQRYKVTIEGRTSPTFSPVTSDRSTTPPPSEHAPSSDREELCHVVIPEGQYICIVPTKHNPVFGIVAQNVTYKMSSGRCIMANALSSQPTEVQILPMEKLQKAVARMNLNVYKQLCPSKHLD